MGKKSYVKYDYQYELEIPGYPKGSDITILNASYVGRRKNEETGEFDKDFISILFKDNTNGSKRIYTIYEPEYTFFVLKNQYAVPDHVLFFIEREKVYPCTCKYRDLLRALAEVTDNEKFYFENQRSGNSNENKKLHTCPEVFMSDMNIENYYRFLFSLQYQNNEFTLTKGFMDIETDIMYCDLRFPEPGEVPINAIAYCDEANKTVYQFILNDKRNPLVDKYRISVENGNTLSELKDFVIEAVGGKKKAIKYGCDNLKYVIKFYDDELELIRTMFKVIHTTLPDFIEFWNWAFDLNYIIARIIELGADPMDIICDPRIKPEVLRFYVDTRNKNDYEERGDFAQISMYSVFLDQMIQFASRRKGRSKYQSFKLDAIGEVVADVNKLDYSHITDNLGKLPYLDMKTFSFYNVMDVIVQKCIEKSTQDLEYIFTKCLINNTTYSKGHRQSVYLTNRFSKEFYSYGFIKGNNKNLWNEKPNIKFPGAAVGDPTHVSKKIMIHINGRPTYIVDNDVDFDYSSLYPSIILENNMAPNTQIGRIIIEDPNDPNRQFSICEHPDMYSSDEEIAKYSRGGEFLENYMCNSPIEFGRRWLGLGDVYQVISDIKEFYSKPNTGYRGRGLDTEFNAGIYFTKSKMEDGIIFLNGSYQTNSLIFDNHLSKEEYNRLTAEIRRGATL